MRRTQRSDIGKVQAGWYKLARWLTTRRAQLREYPLCRMCLDVGRTTRATIADHVIPPRGDWELFWNGELQSLCKNHHDQVKQQQERIGYSTEVGQDGNPLDPSHPWNAPGVGGKKL